MSIEHVSDTARWVAVYRAMETERPDGHFRDPFARALAGERGEEIVRTIKRGRAAAWAMITRTQVFDEIILRAVHSGGVDTVVNLAAGLDARPWRLGLPASLRWVDVDFPDILRYKRSVIGAAAPHCRYETAEVDLTNAAMRGALFAQLGREARRALVVSEGLLIYLTAADVSALAADLHRQPAFREWLFDLANPRLLKWMTRSWGKEAARGNAPFRFAPAEGPDFFAPYGWRVKERRSQMEEARRLRREMPGMGFFRLIGKLYPKRTQDEMRYMASIVVLERAES